MGGFLNQYQPQYVVWGDISKIKNRPQISALKKIALKVSEQNALKIIFRYYFGGDEKPQE